MIAKELEEAKRKHSRMELLEYQLQQEKGKNRLLREKNYNMREKFLKLIEMVQSSTVDEENQNNENEKFMQEVATENQYLRELIKITKLSDPEYQDISEFLAKEEEEATTNNTTLESPFKLNLEFADSTPEYKLTQDVIDGFKKEKLQQKAAAKKSLSIESQDSTPLSNDNSIIQGGGETPILLNHQSPANREGNHINFMNSETLLLPQTPNNSNKENNDTSSSLLFLKGGSLNNSLIGLNTSTSSVVFRNSLDNKIGEK